MPEALRCAVFMPKGLYVIRNYKMQALFAKIGAIAILGSICNQEYICGVL
jgi:hypothetical protein